MNEDTLKETEEAKANDAMLDEMMRDAEKAEPPSELRDNPIIHRGDETQPAPMIVKEISSAGYVWVWDTRTFEKMPVLYYMIRQILNRRRPDGSFQYTVKNPGKEPIHGTIKCMLHQDSPNREHYDELGFRVCKKSNITNPYQLKQHMIKKHPQEWAAIEEERKEKERQEDRALQQMLLSQQLKEVESTQKPETPSEVVKQKSDGFSELENIKELGDNEYICSECNKIHRMSSKLGKRHLKYKK